MKIVLFGLLAAIQAGLAHAQNPADANGLGEALYARGDIAGAEAAFRRATQQETQNRFTAEINLAELLFHRGQREEAFRRFHRLVDLYNSGEANSAEALMAVGTAARYLGLRDPELFKDALRAFDEAAEVAPENPEPRVRVGELFLEKYNSPDAQKALVEALQSNPSHARALLAMARAKEFDGEGAEALALVQRSLQADPRLVPARVMLARAALDSEDPGAAETEVRKALETNPSSLDALSVLAAIRYLQGDRRGYEEATRRVRRLNPSHAGLYVTVGELAARHRRYADAVSLAREAIQLDSLSWSAHALLGLNLLRVGRPDEARRALERSFEGDPYNVWVKNTLDLLDTYAQYQVHKTPHFELVLHGDEADLLLPYAAALAEEAYEKLTTRYGFRPEGPVRVEFFPRHADFSVRTVGLTGLGALGVSFGNVLALASPAAREIGDTNWGSTLWHEMAHAVTLGLSGNRVPRWLTEGISVLEERRARPGWGSELSPDFVAAYAGRELPPVSTLNEGFLRPRSPAHVGYAYHLASLVVEWIEETRGTGAVGEMLRAYGKGMGTSDVLRSALKAEPAVLDREFDAWLRARSAAQFAATERGGELRSLLAQGQADLRQGKLDEAKRALERAAQLFPTYAHATSSPYALLAQIHQRQGNPRAAAEALTRLTAVNENAYKANVELAGLLEQLGDARGAAAALDRAIYIYPYEIPVHTRLAELYAKAGERDKAVRERRAVVALRPVDQVEARYQLALALLEAGDRDGARVEVLRALEAAPGYERAQELLLRLRGGT